jgi:hypothetical protein
MLWKETSVGVSHLVVLDWCRSEWSWWMCLLCTAGGLGRILCFSFCLQMCCHSSCTSDSFLIFCLTVSSSQKLTNYLYVQQKICMRISALFVQLSSDLLGTKINTYIEVTVNKWLFLHMAGVYTYSCWNADVGPVFRTKLKVSKSQFVHYLWNQTLVAEYHSFRDLGKAMHGTFSNVPCSPTGRPSHLIYHFLSCWVFPTALPILFFIVAHVTWFMCNVINQQDAKTQFFVTVGVAHLCKFALWVVFLVQLLPVDLSQAVLGAGGGLRVNGAVLSLPHIPSWCA